MKIALPLSLALLAFTLPAPRASAEETRRGAEKLVSFSGI